MSLFINEMQIKTQLLKWLKIQTMLSTDKVCEAIGNLMLLRKCKIVHPFCNSWAVTEKLNIHSYYDPVITLPELWPSYMKTYVHINLHMKVYGGFINNY